jgi:hypothetical protein
MTQIVLGDLRIASRLAFPVTTRAAADAFRHPFSHAPMNGWGQRNFGT